MLKPLLLMTSWKAYEPAESIDAFIKETAQKQTEHVRYAFALPYEVLKELSQHHTYPNVLLGALHMNSVAEGSFTKDIAGKLLKKAGAAFVLIGSDFERRVLGETEHSFQQKIKEAQELEIVPFLCVGETAEEHLDEKGSAVLEHQLKTAFEGFSPEQIEKIGIFFESPWMRQVAFKPTAKEVTDSYQINHKILENIVGEVAAGKMQVIHTAPEDLEGFSPPSDKGVFVLQHHMHKVSEHAESVLVRLAEKKSLETLSTLEDVVEETLQLAIQHGVEGVVSDQTGHAMPADAVSGLERVVAETPALAIEHTPALSIEHTPALAIEHKGEETVVDQGAEESTIEETETCLDVIKEMPPLAHDQTTENVAVAQQEEETIDVDAKSHIEGSEGETPALAPDFATLDAAAEYVTVGEQESETAAQEVTSSHGGVVEEASPLAIKSEDVAAGVQEDVYSIQETTANQKPTPEELHAPVELEEEASVVDQPKQELSASSNSPKSPQGEPEKPSGKPCKEHKISDLSE